MDTLRHNYWKGKSNDVSIEIGYIHYSLTLKDTEPRLIFLDNGIWVYERDGFIYSRISGDETNNWKDKYFILY